MEGSRNPNVHPYSLPSIAGLYYLRFMKRFVLLLGLLFLSPAITAPANAQEAAAQPVLRNTSAQDVITQDTTVTKDSAQPMYYWYTLMVTVSSNISGDQRFKAIPFGIAYDQLITKHLSIGIHAKAGPEQDYVEMGAQLGYNYYPNASKLYLLSLTVSPSFVESMHTFGDGNNVQRFEHNAGLLISLEGGFGVRIFDGLEFMVTRRWAFSPAGIDAGSSLQLRFGLLP